MVTALDNGQALHIVKMLAREFELATACLSDSLQHYHRCGELLNVQKKQLSHGLWLGWIERNEKALGFSERTARRLMDFAVRYPNRTLTSDLPEQKALTLSRELWTNEPNGSKPKKAKKARSNKKKRATLAPIASEEDAPLSQPAEKFMLAANTERTHKARSLMVKRFLQALDDSRALVEINGVNWSKHRKLAEIVYDVAYFQGVMDMEKGLI